MVEEFPTHVAAIPLSKIQNTSLEEKRVTVFAVHLADFGRFFLDLHACLAKVEVTGNVVTLEVAVLLREFLPATIAHKFFASVNNRGAECHYMHIFAEDFPCSIPSDQRIVACLHRT